MQSYDIIHPGLVSVIVPCYNYGAFLPECVLSVINQTYQRWQLIIVDDGSTDNTTAIAERLRQIYSAFPIEIVRHIRREGMNAARNTGVQNAQGEYILALDADDLIAPTFLDKTVGVIRKDLSLGFTYTDVLLFGTMHAIWHIGQFTIDDLKVKNRIVTHSLVRRQAWSSVGGYNESMRLGYEDWDFWLSLAEHGWKWKGVPEQLALYRKHGTSMIDIARNRSIILRAQIILNHPTLYGKKVVQIAQDIMRIEQHLLSQSNDTSAVKPIFQTTNGNRHKGKIRSTFVFRVKPIVLKLLDEMPLYHQMLLRKWWYLLQTHRGT